jgi:hypothetical protein
MDVTLLCRHVKSRCVPDPLQREVWTGKVDSVGLSGLITVPSCSLSAGERQLELRYGREGHEERNCKERQCYYCLANSSILTIKSLPFSLSEDEVNVARWLYIPKTSASN